jgi:3-carboxy-cis,cis-muconate cycloisomerase
MNYLSAIYSKYLSSEKMLAVVSDEALIEKMIRFEAALASAQQKLDIIPSSAANTLIKVLNTTKVKPQDLAEGTLHNGIPVIPLLTIIKGKLSEDAKEFLHYGATSQDTLDTAQILMVSDAIRLLSKMIEDFNSNLERLDKKFGRTRCMGRTRGQLAVPITFGLRIKSWMQPMNRQQQRLKELSVRLLKIQLGGAVGDLSFFKENGKGLLEELALQLGLASSTPWHSQRDVMAEFSNWLALTSGNVGKMGADVLVMSQNEIGEVEELGEGGGKSSSMPHKNNPVLSEAMVALATLNASLQSRMLQALVHENERDATAWILEWETLRQMLLYTASSLSHAIKVTSEMKVHADIMERNVAAFLTKNEK